MRAKQESRAEGMKWGRHHQARAGRVRGEGSLPILEGQTSPALCSGSGDR